MQFASHILPRAMRALAQVTQALRCPRATHGALAVWIAASSACGPAPSDDDALSSMPHALFAAELAPQPQHSAIAVVAHPDDDLLFMSQFIVSAIGHENDHPLLDDVADLRASTPTDAAKRVVPDVGEELLRVQQARARMTQRLTHLVGVEIDRVGQIRSRPVLANPQTLIDVRADELVRSVARSEELVRRAIERAATRLAELTGQLRALSPESTLRRGYSIAQLPSGAVLRDASDAPEGTELLLTLATGTVGTTSSGPLTIRSETAETAQGTAPAR